MEKLYVIARKDLPSGLLCAQAIHAAVDFQHWHRKEAEAWHRDSNTVVVLETPDQESLRGLILRLEQELVSLTVFTEPDLDDAVTSIAFISSGNIKWLRDLPLAFSS